MYGLPTDFDATIFVGHALEQICFNANQIALHFDADLSVIVECSFVHDDPARQPPNEIINVPAVSCDLMSLLGVPVSAAAGHADGTLFIRFENGHSLRIEDTSAMYESYRIQHKEREIIV